MVQQENNEIWKDIYIIENDIEYDYRGLYQVSNLGRVRSLIRYKNKYYYFKGISDKDGYLYVKLRKNNNVRQFFIHRLVAHMFIENDDSINKNFVNHKDENTTNNIVSNLEWCTHKYNINYGTRTKRASEKESIPIAQYDTNMNLIKIWKNAREVNKELGYSFCDICSVCKFWELNCNTEEWYKTHKARPRKKARGFIWKYYKGED